MQRYLCSPRFDIETRVRPHQMPATWSGCHALYKSRPPGAVARWAGLGPGGCCQPPRRFNRNVQTGRELQKVAGRSPAIPVPAYQLVECAMLFGVAVVATSILISVLAALAVDTAYRAVVDRCRPDQLPLTAVAASLVAAVLVASLISAWG